ncbi:MAG TPA: hypothetical protein PLI95_17220 [Polyangiaceae bacterium]|nr:hypothetical protein [Polyangiaceae bacterium]
MLTLRGLWIAVPVAAAMIAGCKDDKAAAPAPVQSSTAPVVQPSAPPAGSLGRLGGPRMMDRRGPHALRRHEGGGAMMLLRMAREIELREAQKVAVEDIQKSLRTDDAPPGGDFKAIHAVMVAGVRAGKIDNAKLDALRAEAEKAAEARRDKENGALQRLHAALDAAQRKALVAAVRAKQTERKERGPRPMRGGPPAPSASGAAPSASAPAAAPPPAGSAPAMTPVEWQKRRLEKLTKDLGLDADQQKKVDALLAKAAPKPPEMNAAREEQKKRAEALLAAFEQDVFDAKKLEQPTPPAKKDGAMSLHTQLLNDLLPILKPEQREKLAASMEKQPDRRPARWRAADPGYGVLFDDDDDDNDEADDAKPEGPKPEGPKP